MTTQARFQSVGVAPAVTVSTPPMTAWEIAVQERLCPAEHPGWLWADKLYGEDRYVELTPDVPQYQPIVFPVRPSPPSPPTTTPAQVAGLQVRGVGFYGMRGLRAPVSTAARIRWDIIGVVGGGALVVSLLTGLIATALAPSR